MRFMYWRCVSLFVIKNKEVRWKMKYRIRETGSQDNKCFETDKTIFYIDVTVSWQRIDDGVITITLESPFKVEMNVEGISIKPRF